VKILFKFGLSHISKTFNDLPFGFPLHIHTHPKVITFWIETLTTLKKRLKILVEKSLGLWSDSHCVIC
jgi:hypothetical protein